MPMGIGKEDKRLTATVAALRGLEKGDLETLLKTIINPPPDIIVQFNDDEKIFSRDILQICSMKFLFTNFTTAFNIQPIPGIKVQEGEEKIIGERSKRQLRYVPLILYATFIYGPAADGRYREVPMWDTAWSKIVPNIERIVIKRTGEDKDIIPKGESSSKDTLTDGSEPQSI